MTISTTRGLCLLAALLVGSPAQIADKVSDGQWYHHFLNTKDAQAITAGNGTIVAVIDTGVDGAHPDLAGSVLGGADFTESGGDGRLDMDGHGTAMAGLIAAHGRVRGIAPLTKILPVRVNAGTQQGSGSALAQGVNWAAGNGAKVISISHGGPDDLLLTQEVQSALAKDVVVVASVGNRPDDRTVIFPAAIPGVVAVAGVDRNGNRSTVSVTGPEVVISAPSDRISSTDKGGGYSESTGTSDATAIVAGAAALVRAKFPQLKASEVVRRLTATAVDKGAPGRDNEYGYGVLNIVGALTADLPTSTTTAPPKPTTGASPATSKPDSWFRWWMVAIPVAVLGTGAVAMFVRRRRR